MNFVTNLINFAKNSQHGPFQLASPSKDISSILDLVYWLHSGTQAASFVMSNFDNRLDFDVLSLCLGRFVSGS